MKWGKAERARQAKAERNLEIRKLWRKGISGTEIADRFHVTPATVYRINRDHRRSRGVRKIDQSQRTDRMTAMRLAGATLEQIGIQEGVSRERVRQILNGQPRPKVKSDAQRRREAEAFRVQFKRSMPQWLHDAGYYRCFGACKQWMKKELITSSNRCRSCHNTYHRELARQPKHRLAQQKWKESEKGKASIRAAQQRYWARRRAEESR